MATGESNGKRNALFEEAARHPLLAREEEQELARRAEAGDGEAAYRLIGSHLRYVIKIARRYRGFGLPMSELVQQGALGLVQAVRRFDPDQGVRLSTYAMWWIRSAIQEHVLASWSVVRAGTSNAQKTLLFTLRRTAAELGLNGERLNEDLLAALAARFGISGAEVGALARRVLGGDASLDRPLAGGRTLGDDIVSDGPTPEQKVARAGEQRFLNQALQAAMSRLSPREQLIIRRRYFEEARQTFDAIGRELGVSKDRVRQLEIRALAKLRALLQPVLVNWR